MRNQPASDGFITERKEIEMLTNDDIDVLIEALDALQFKHGNSAFTSVLLGAMLSKNKDEDTFRAEANKTMEEARQKGKSMEETVILLKAKLIGMRDRVLVDEMSAHLKTG